MLPAMKMTEPYSPTARAKASARPAAAAGASAGSTTRVTARQREAPSSAAASSNSGSRSASTGCTVRTTKGRPMKRRAMNTPAGVKASFTPNSAAARPARPFGAQIAVSATPATAVGSAKGRSISASARRRPGKR